MWAPKFYNDFWIAFLKNFDHKFLGKLIDLSFAKLRIKLQVSCSVMLT